MYNLTENQKKLISDLVDLVRVKKVKENFSVLRDRRGGILVHNAGDKTGLRFPDIGTQDFQALAKADLLIVDVIEPRFGLLECTLRGKAYEAVDSNFAASADIPVVQNVAVKVKGVSSGTSPLNAFGSLFSPTSLVAAAKNAHPAFRYAIAAAALAGLVAIVTRYGVSPATLVFGAIILVVLMVLFLVFSQAAVVAHAVMSVPAMALVWSFLFLSILTAIFLFTSAFFDAPLPIRSSLIRQLGAANSNAAGPVVQQRALPLTAPTSALTPNPEATGHSELGMTLEEFRSKYDSLDGRFAEQEAFVARCDNKCIHWIVKVNRLETSGEHVSLLFSSKSMGQRTVAYVAEFPAALKTRIYSLRANDLVAIEGVLRANSLLNNLKVEATGYELVEGH
jgi:hypothetical protein